MFDTDSPDYALSAAQWAGFALDEQQLEILEAFVAWLRHEALPAGGLGRGEGDRLWGRHIGDSLVFAQAWGAPPHEVLDVGSGVGLPGLPLAVLWPETRVTLLDRGGRRTRLLVRAVRILGLENVKIARGDIFDVADPWESLTFRGAVTPPQAVGVASRLLMEGGTAVVGLSRRPQRPDRSDDLVALAAGLGLIAEVLLVPAGILDGPAWLLIVRRGE